MTYDTMGKHHSAIEFSASRSAFCGFGTPEGMQLPNLGGLTWPAGCQIQGSGIAFNMLYEINDAP
jgi:hypothetical protein